MRQEDDGTKSKYFKRVRCCAAFQSTQQHRFQAIFITDRWRTHVPLVFLKRFFSASRPQVPRHGLDCAANVAPLQNTSRYRLGVDGSHPFCAHKRSAVRLRDMWESLRSPQRPEDAHSDTYIRDRFPVSVFPVASKKIELARTTPYDFTRMLKCRERNCVLIRITGMWVIRS